VICHSRIILHIITLVGVDDGDDALSQTPFPFPLVDGQGCVKRGEKKEKSGPWRRVNGWKIIIINSRTVAALGSGPPHRLRHD
jgi:hypothetical protein